MSSGDRLPAQRKRKVRYHDPLTRVPKFVLEVCVAGRGKPASEGVGIVLGRVLFSAGGVAGLPSRRC